MQIARVVQMYDQRVIGGPALEREYLGDRRWIGRVCAEPVDGFRRERDQVPGTQRLDGFLDFGLRCSDHRRS
jgi:hypothetical protein